MDEQQFSIPKVALLMQRFLSLLLEKQTVTIVVAKSELLSFPDAPNVQEEDVARKFDIRFGWARSYLKTAGLVTSPERGVFSISDTGRKLAHSTKIKLLEEYLGALPQAIYGTKNAQSIGDQSGEQQLLAASSPKRTENRIEKQNVIGGNGVNNLKSYFKTGLEAKATDEAKKIWMQTVEVFFGADRSEDTEKPPSTRFGKQRGDYQIGTVTVSIPLQHKTGNIERPKWYRFELNVDPKKHMTLLDVSILNSTEMEQRIKTLYPEKLVSAFVFVHGYNVSFESAALRTAQMAFDLGLKSLPSFFSWPSQDSMHSYSEDESNIEWAEPHVKQFLETFAKASKATEIVIIAHSMGTRAVTRALASLRFSSPDLAHQFKELVLAAPDIDADVFKRDLLPVLVASAQSVTLYASANDRALQASKRIHGSPRAGDIGPGMIVEPGLETIDASSIDTDFLGHSYFAQSRPLLTDLEILISAKLKAGRRPQLSAVGTSKGTYWKFRA